jgi:hypothetical protein
VLKQAGHDVVHLAELPSPAGPLRDSLRSAFPGQAPTAVVQLASLDGSRASEENGPAQPALRICAQVLQTVQAMGGGTAFRATTLGCGCGMTELLGGMVFASFVVRAGEPPTYFTWRETEVQRSSTPTINPEHYLSKFSKWITAWWGVFRFKNEPTRGKIGVW